MILKYLTLHLEYLGLSLQGQVKCQVYHHALYRLFLVWSLNSFLNRGKNRKSTILYPFMTSNMHVRIIGGHGGGDCRVPHNPL